MNKVFIANVLLTRKCNLTCSYCNIVKDYDDMPIEYPKMGQYHLGQIKPSKWIDIINRLVKNNPDIFFIFYGGEPMLYKGIETVIKHCNDNNIAYTIISNNTEDARAIAYRIFDNIGPFRGFTSSVDPIAFLPDRNDDIALKSRAGLEYLSKMKADGIADDVVAEITVTKDSVPYLIRMVEELSERGIYSSITAIDDQKSVYYDFSNVTSEVLLEPNDELKNIFKQLQDGAAEGKYLIHIPELLDDLLSVLPSKMKCTLNKDIHNVSIEPTGHFRLCLRVRGTNAPKIPYERVISEDGEMSEEFISMIKKDYSDYCLGCNWTCPIMSDTFSKDIIDHG